MSNYNTVLVERDDGVAVVSLNRPASLNAFDAQLRHELRRPCGRSTMIPLCGW